jgi:hypothetical protein
VKKIKIEATAGDIPGEIELHWDSHKTAKSYVIEFCRKPGSKWIMKDIVSDARCNISGLKSRMNYYFRVAAIYNKGIGSWSQTVEKKTN